MDWAKIYEGWKNHLIPSKKLKSAIVKISNERLKICKMCYYHSDNRTDYHTLRTDKHCTDCGCTLIAKTKCLSCSCSLLEPKWTAMITIEEEDLFNINEKSGDKESSA